ncbi:unnamed protein product [Cylicostephanus goldi]|uniref:Uncharacterized protein n=1 Tax=Cylicostephanus goldi TaxID=71465 RepID=A0A3P7QYT5_CYLGO|nr:unnamed protein product [Cylicostephanus goldi]
MEGTSDYREEYRQQYPGDYWNEQEPLSYNSRPPQPVQPFRPWHDSVEAAESGTEREKSLDDQNTYVDSEGRNSKASYRTPSVDKTERRYDSDASYLGGRTSSVEKTERRYDSDASRRTERTPSVDKTERRYDSDTSRRTERTPSLEKVERRYDSDSSHRGDMYGDEYDNR